MKQALQDSSPVWRVRDARLVLLARGVMMAVHSLVLVTLQLRVHDGGGGPRATTILMVALALPAVATVGVTGVVADSRDSRTVVSCALGLQLVAVLALASGGALWWTMAWAVALETGFAFTGPVWSALVPRVVGEAGVQQLASAQMVVTSVTAPVGAGLGGWLVQTHGDRPSLVAGAALVVLAGALSAAIRTRRGGRRDPLLVASADEAPSSRGEWREGVRALRRDPVLWVIYLGLGPLCLLVNGIAVLEVYLVRDHLHGSATDYGLTELFFGLGAIGGAVVAGRLRDDGQRVRATLGGFGVAVTMVAVAGLVPSFASYAAVITALGLGNAYANGALGPLFVLRSPERVRGRVQAALSATMSAALVVALPMGGVLGSTLGVRQGFVVCGVAGLAGVLAMAVGLRGRATS